MDAVNRLLNLEFHQLSVFRAADGIICVKYEGAWISDGVALTGTVGRGRTFEEACEDYLGKISGKKLVFERTGGKREEVVVL
jgi:hypothetical protein